MKDTALWSGSIMMLGSLPVRASAYSDGSDILKLAFTGCGRRGGGIVNLALMAEDGGYYPKPASCNKCNLS